MTYDMVWFDMVRMRNPSWRCEEIYSTPELIPIHRGSGDYLQKAQEHLSINNDYQAAAVYKGNVTVQTAIRTTRYGDNDERFRSPTER
jgi:hypothetical protein